MARSQPKASNISYDPALEQSHNMALKDANNSDVLLPELQSDPGLALIEDEHLNLSLEHGDIVQDGRVGTDMDQVATTNQEMGTHLDMGTEGDMEEALHNHSDRDRDPNASRTMTDAEGGEVY